jgi:hypothetical protein
MFKTLVSIICSTILLIGISQFSVAQTSSIPQGNFIRLVAELDEPEYYCFDLMGWGEHLQLEDPLQTHTCKNTAESADQMFYFEGNKLKIAGYDRCVQAAGSNQTTLAGSAVLARTCANNALQDFSLKATGKIQLNNTPFCLSAGPESTKASGPSHVWRTLHIAECDSADNELSTWQIGL